MGCLPSYLVSGIVIALIIFDIYSEAYDKLPFHGIVGVVFVTLFWLLCKFVGQGVAGAVLVVPVIVLLIFGLGIWMNEESYKKKGCCVTCNPPPINTCSTLTSTPIESEPVNKCSTNYTLSATPLT